MKQKTLLIMGWLSLFGFGSCHAVKQDNKEPADNGIPESYGDSLVGKFVINFREFKLYDQPEGKVMEELYPAQHYGGHVKERRGDWIRFEDLCAINKFAVPFSGWTKWCNNDSIMFKIIADMQFQK